MPEEQKKEEQVVEEKDLMEDEVVKKIKRSIQKTIDLNKAEELVRKNKIEFEFEKTKYRVRQPSFKEKQEAYQQRTQKFTELLQNDKYMLEDDLKKQYKKRGIDIDGITAQINTLESKKSGFKFKLGKLLKEKGSKKDIETYRKEIEDIKDNQQSLSIRKTSLLQFSIESQSLIYVYSYITYLITEKKEGDKWIKAWESYEEFIDNPDQLIERASWYGSLIMGQL